MTLFLLCSLFCYDGFGKSESIVDLGDVFTACHCAVGTTTAATAAYHSHFFHKLTCLDTAGNSILTARCDEVELAIVNKCDDCNRISSFCFFIVSFSFC